MKCTSCGAEIGNSRFCSYCGTQINTEMLREKELLNKAGCPRCGSTNVTFNRENQGEIRGKNSKKIVHYTVGVCRDCGFTWRTDGGQTTHKRKTWLWVLGWIFIFPLPLTLILLKKKDMNAMLKYGIIAIAWVLYLIFAFSGRSADKTIDNSTETKAQIPIVQESEDTRKSEDISTTEKAAEKTTEEITTEEPTEEKTTEAKTTEAKTTETTTSREYIKCTATELFDVLENNALKAKSTYEGAYVEISGYITNIDASGKYISIGARSDDYDYFLDSIQCYIKDDATLKKVMDLSTDSYVTIKGKIISVGEIFGYSMNIESIN